MSRGPYQLGGMTFKTIENVRLYARAIKEKYAGPVMRLVIEPEYFRFMADLLRWHPNPGPKIGPGIETFWVVPDKERGCRTYHFAVRRIDGSFSHFSFNTCLNRRLVPQELRIKSALRQAINPQIEHYRNTNLVSDVTLCPLTGELLTLGNCHVDHVPPRTFEWLVEKWLEWNELRLDQVEIYEAVPNEAIYEMADADQQASWGEHHRLHANLRLLSVRGNCSASVIEANRLKREGKL